jgi:hypothetical protein
MEFCLGGALCFFVRFGVLSERNPIFFLSMISLATALKNAETRIDAIRGVHPRTAKTSTLFFLQQKHTS